jgi:hypothetical protein
MTLEQVMKTYKISPGTTVYFKKDHPSGLGGLEFYIPQNPDARTLTVDAVRTGSQRKEK